MITLIILIFITIEKAEKKSLLLFFLLKENIFKQVNNRFSGYVAYV